MWLLNILLLNILVSSPSWSDRIQNNNCNCNNIYFRLQQICIHLFVVRFLPYRSNTVFILNSMNYQLSGYAYSMNEVSALCFICLRLLELFGLIHLSTLPGIIINLMPAYWAVFRRVSPGLLLWAMTVIHSYAHSLFCMVFFCLVLLWGRWWGWARSCWLTLIFWMGRWSVSLVSRST